MDSLGNADRPAQATLGMVTEAAHQQVHAPVDPDMEDHTTGNGIAAAEPGQLSVIKVEQAVFRVFEDCC
jgi:hypothetical protein